MAENTFVNPDVALKSFRITTSWDDGHPCDLRLAELLAKYELPATFYVPQTSERPTMSEREMQGLASDFEIGAHTLDHSVLTKLESRESRRQIEHSKDWVEQVTGRCCRVFCPPRGRFSSVHARQVTAAGFFGIRTTEMLDLDGARRSSALMILPTTIQAHPHRWTAYMRNGLRRRSPPALFRLLREFRDPWESFAKRLVELTSIRRGVFHLWGHSWEIEENNHWERLEEVLKLLAAMVESSKATTETNEGLCRPFVLQDARTRRALSEQCCREHSASIRE